MTAVNASMSVAILAYLPPTIPRSDMYDGPMPFSVARTVLLTLGLVQVVVERDEVDEVPIQTIAAVAWNQRKIRSSQSVV